MDEAWLSAAVAAGAALGASALTGFISWRVAETGRQGRQSEELAAAIVAFSYALDRLRAELAELPPAREANHRLERAIANFPTVDWWLRQMTRHTVARSGLKAMDGVIAASNRLVLIAPERILECVDRIHTLLEDPRPRDDGWAADWIDARGELLQVARVFVPSA